MSMNHEVLKELVDIFKTELSENLQIITDGLLALEKHDMEVTHDKVIEEIFRAGHNIKGSSRSIGINDVSDIAHEIESIFTSIRDNKQNVSLEMINLCFEAVDGMHAAMQSFCENQPLPFDLKDLLNRLRVGGGLPIDTTDSTDNSDPISTTNTTQNNLITAPKKETFTNRRSNIKASVDNLVEHNTIRVALRQLDKIAALLEEMQVNKISIDEHYLDLVKLATKTKQFTRPSLATPDLIIEAGNTISLMRKNFYNSINELNTITNSIQEEVRMLRLVPASNLLRTLKRTARDLANNLNKQVDLEIINDDIKMDKMILQNLKDPITHILRNAIDHGIELPELRVQNNKPATAHIIIHVVDEGDQILLTIKDDGAGIDYKKIAAAAEKKKVATKSELEKMQSDEIINLIFHPGFSTKEIITDISGRGVGLDVVKSNLANIKGDVTVQTEINKGTVFQLRFPLTLSGDVGLIIKTNNQVFVIPTSTVERVLMAQKKDIITVQGSQVILIEDKPVPLRTLATVLKLDNGADISAKNQFPIVLLKKGTDYVALIVDEIIGKREIVIKPLSSPLINILCVAGGTLLGNGQVAIVLNSNDVINTAVNKFKGSSIITSSEETSTVQQYHVLLADDSITTRTLGKNILENNNYKVTVAVDGAQAWELLQHQTFDLLMTDIEMPNMTGLELTAKVRSSDTHKDLPVIICTSLGSEAQIKHGIEVGANAYIVKHDFESKELLEIVGQLV